MTDEPKFQPGKAAGILSIVPLVGTVLIGVGLWWIYPPASLIVTGLLVSSWATTIVSTIRKSADARIAEATGRKP